MSTTASIFAPVLSAVRALTQAPALIAIDGRCGSGKSTLAALLERELSCPVFHTDDFYLPFERRTPELLTRPAGHMELTRLESEVLKPFLAGSTVRYTAFFCGTGAFLPPVKIPPAPIAIVEGSYSLHPLLAGFYTKRVVLTCTPKVQRERILARGGAAALLRFEEQWIPREEAYLREFDIEANCDFLIDTSENV